MRLLFDENLSRKLTARLRDLYPDSRHVADVGLIRCPDLVVWEYAREHGFAIVTADADFFELATNAGPPPKVIWLRRWTHPTRDAEALLRREAIRVADFGNDRDLGVFVLDRI